MAQSQRKSFGMDANGLGVEHVSVHGGVQKSVLFARLSSVEPTPEESDTLNTTLHQEGHGLYHGNRRRKMRCFNVLNDTTNVMRTPLLVSRTSTYKKTRRPTAFKFMKRRRKLSRTHQNSLSSSTIHKRCEMTQKWQHGGKRLRRDVIILVGQQCNSHAKEPSRHVESL